MTDKDIPPEKIIGALLQNRSRREIMVILGKLEHGGAGIYKSLAAEERNEKAREALLAAAEREEENSALLKLMTSVKDKCEKCGGSVALGTAAFCCSFQCTFCGECAAGLTYVCPNCAGQLSPRVTT